VGFCGCAAFARCCLSLKPLCFVLPPYHQRRLFRGAAFRAFYSTRAQPGAQAELRQKPRSPVTSTLGITNRMERMLTDQEAAELGRAIDALIAERGLGAISKKDYELLVFHHLSSSSALQSDGNYLLANKFKVTETKIKSLRLEASIRHKPANHKAVLGDIAQRIIDEMHKPDFSSGMVSITLENPIDRREFEHAIKTAKHSVEYGINREILRIDALALFEIILENVEHAEMRFKEIVQAHIKTKAKQQEVLDNTLTLRQKINKLGQEVTSNGGAVSLLSAAAGLL
jgi:hypothetical protein